MSSVDTPWEVHLTWDGDEAIVTLPPGPRPSIHEVLCVAADELPWDRRAVALGGWGTTRPAGCEDECGSGGECNSDGEWDHELCGCWWFTPLRDGETPTHARVEKRCWDWGL